MAKKKQVSEESEVSVGQTALANALISAIEAAKPPVKKTVFTRVKNTPWSPKNGEPRLKLKRKMYHHGLLITTRVSNKEIDLLNKIRPGVFLDGHVTVRRRRDKGIDIDYPIKTAAQRLKLVNQFGIRDFAELLSRVILEAENPEKYRVQDDE